MVSAVDDKKDLASTTGVLRAVLGGDKIEGQLLTAFTAGGARVSVSTSRGTSDLGRAEVGTNGEFSIPAEKDRARSLDSRTFDSPSSG